MILRCCACQKPTEAYGEVAEGRWLDLHGGDERVFLCDDCYCKYARAQKNQSK